MSRKAMEKSPEVDIVIAQIQEYLKKNNLSVLEFAGTAGVSQPSLCRFLAGDRKTVTEVARQCLAFMRENDNGNNRHNNYATYHSTVNHTRFSIDLLIGAIKRGEPGSVEIVVSVLDKLRQVLDVLPAVGEAPEDGDVL